MATTSFRHVTVIEVIAWGRRVGAVASDPHQRSYVFEYDPAWVARGVQLAPFMMPADPDRPGLFTFPSLVGDTFHGLPGLLSDALPDRFGNRLIDAWLAQRGLRPGDASVLDRLAYMNKRGMGALEFRPARGATAGSAAPIQMARLVEQARRALHAGLGDDDASAETLTQLISVGTSAGGARAKAVVGLDPDTGDIVAGQFDVPDGFEHWLLKFDGVGPDQALGPSQQYGRIEYAYYQMASAAGIHMTPSQLLHEGGRAHFMTRRFDRDGNAKVHVQSLCALRHLDYNLVGTHAYESLFLTAFDLGLGADALMQLFTRMAFNVAARNQDDHTKNFAFLMRKDRPWELAPAYDVTFAFNPSSHWVSAHQMSVNGRFDDITRADLLTVADRFGVPDPRGALDAVNEALAQWPALARHAGVEKPEIDRIAALHRHL